MDCTTITPFDAALDAIEVSNAAASRLLFNDKTKRALRQWIPRLEADAPGQPQPIVDTHQFSITLRAPGVDVQLVMPWSIDMICASVLAAGSWSSDVQLACLRARANSVLNGAVDWFCANGLHPVSLQRQCEGLDMCEGDIAFGFRVGNHRIHGRLRCTDTNWVSILNLELARKINPRLASVARVPIPIRVALGTRRLKLALLRSLTIGDVLIVEIRCPSDDAIDAVELLVGKRGSGILARRCSARGRDITVNGDKWMNTATTFTPSAQEEDAGNRPQRSAKDSLADIEVDIHLELQVLSTPVGELANMLPGYVLELPVAASQACVDLVVGGQVHGRAQLVRVGDRLGARIIELFSES